MMQSLYIDDVFDTIGNFKWEQKVYFVVLSLLHIFLAFHMVLNIFTGLEGSFTCTPIGGNSSVLINSCPNNSPEKCYFQYNSSYRSIQEEWNLVCQDKYKIPLVQSIFMAGVMVGALLLGSVADRIGRLRTLMISLICTIGFEALSSFVWSYEQYIGLRFLGGVFCSLVILSSFVLSQELVSSSFRSAISLYTGMFFSVGIAVLALLSWTMKDWRMLSFITAASGIPLLLIPCFMPESPRWLLSQNRVEEAQNILQGIAKKNGMYHQLPDKWKLTLIDQTEIKQGAKTLFSHSYMAKITLVLIYQWFVTSTVFYALTLASGKMNLGNVYVSTIFSGLVDLPSSFIIIFLLDRYGRHPSLVGMMFMSGIFSSSIILFALVTPKSVIVLSLLAKLCISGCFGCVYIHSAELFPTNIRNTGMSVVAVAARVGGIVSPFVLMLSDTLPNLQFLVLGILSLIAGFLALYLPETLNKPMPESIQDVVALSKSNAPIQTEGYDLLDKNEDGYIILGKSEDDLVHYDVTDEKLRLINEDD